MTDDQHNESLPSWIPNGGEEPPGNQHDEHDADQVQQPGAPAPQPMAPAPQPAAPAPPTTVPAQPSHQPQPAVNPQQYTQPQQVPQQSFGAQYGPDQQGGYYQSGQHPTNYGQYAPPPQGQPAPQYGYPQQPPAAPQGPPQRTQHLSSLDEVPLIRRAQHAPSRGWRRAVYKASAGKVNPGESTEQMRIDELIRQANQTVRGDYRIAVLSLKGGVGKTTTAIGLGSTLASIRGDRVIAVDANPDLGTLAQRVPQQTTSTVRDLLADTDLTRYSDVRAHTSQAPSRLEVLASERDPATAEAFSEGDYRRVMAILQRHYNIIITDCGTGLSHSAMQGVLAYANTLILVTSPAIDGARSAAATLDWLHAHGYGELAANSIVVIGSSRAGASTIDLEQLGIHFQTRSRAVHQIPFDDHLSEGAEVDLDLLNKHTRNAFIELAATVASDFASTVRRSAKG